jgi:hypothetical protein
VAVTGHTFTKLGLGFAGNAQNWTSDTLKVGLMATYTPGTIEDTAVYVTDFLATGTEVSTSGTGYARKSLSSVTYTESGHVYTLTCANPAWSAATFSAESAFFYDSAGGSDGADLLICYWDFGGADSVTGATFTLTINGSGLLTVTGS